MEESDPLYFDCMSDAFTGSSSFNWCLKEYHASYYMFANQGENEIKELVLTSQRVSRAIDQVCEKEKVERIKMEKKAKEIVDEIAHTFNLKTIRFMAFLLHKIVKKMFRHIYVNRSGIEKLAEQVKFAPLVLVPSHNSYFDFLLTSLVCFAVDLPLPAIASGQDFLHIAVVNRFIRGSGAFFLRRSFAEDEFYKSIFTEYVQQTIKDGRMPVEFFVEGTRSRSGKALHPKTGMLSMITDMFFLGHVPDVLFCPLSISYECITEEQLYLFELLGIPKPKESLSALLKARKVLSSDYGSAHLHFGDVVSLKDFCHGSICRAEYALFPRDQIQTCSQAKKVKGVINSFAKYLVEKQQKKMMIYVRSIIAAGVLQGITNLGDLQMLTIQIGKLLLKFGRIVHQSNNKGIDELINEAVKRCSPVLQIDHRHKTVTLTPFDVSLAEIKKTLLGQSLDESKLLSTVLSKIYLSLQRNKLMHALLIPACVVAAACLHTSKKEIDYNELLRNFSFILDVLFPEIVRHSHANDEEDLKTGLEALKSMSYIDVICDASTKIVRLLGESIVVRFLNGLIRPFLITYWLVGQFMMSNQSFPCESSNLPSKLQLFASSALQLGVVDVYETLSLQTLKNAITSLKRSGCLMTKNHSNASFTINGINREKLNFIISRLGSLAGLPNICLITGDDGKVKVKANL